MILKCTPLTNSKYWERILYCQFWILFKEMQNKAFKYISDIFLKGIKIKYSLLCYKFLNGQRYIKFTKVWIILSISILTFLNSLKMRELRKYETNGQIVKAVHNNTFYWSQQYFWKDYIFKRIAVYTTLKAKSINHTIQHAL